MPELPEVDALVGFLREKTSGAVVAGIETASVSVLKTFDPPISAFSGLAITGVDRHGKFIDVEVDGFHLVIHLARAGWLRWSDRLTDRRLKMGRGPIAARIRLDSGNGPHIGFDLTEAGTHKAMALYAVRMPSDVPGIAALGPEPLDAGFELRPLLGRRMQVKRLLRDQEIIAGIGNAYSDEILHVAGLSPFAIAADLDDVEVNTLERAIHDTLADAVDRAHGKAPADLKDDKREPMRVHGRTGAPCPVCADTVREVTYANSAMQYCPTCQTHGRVLKDRTTSRFLK